MSIYLAGNPAAAERSRQWRKRTGLKLSKAPLPRMHDEVRNALDSADFKQRMGQWPREL